MSNRLTIGCPQCRRRIGVPRDAIGKSARCPACQAKFTIRAPKAGQAPPPGRTATGGAPLPPPASAPRRLSAAERQVAGPVKSEPWPSEEDWFWVRCLLFAGLMFGFCVIAPGLDPDELSDVRGRGRGYARILQFLGGYAPLLGIPLGWWALYSAVQLARQLPAILVNLVGGLGAVVVFFVCLLSFLAATDSEFLDWMKRPSSVAQQQNGPDGQAFVQAPIGVPFPSAGNARHQEMLDRFNSSLPADARAKLERRSNKPANDKPKPQTPVGSLIDEAPVDPFANQRSENKSPPEMVPPTSKDPDPETPAPQPANESPPGGLIVEVADPFAPAGRQPGEADGGDSKTLVAQLDSLVSRHGQSWRAFKQSADFNQISASAVAGKPQSDGQVFYRASQPLSNLGFLDQKSGEDHLVAGPWVPPTIGQSNANSALAGIAFNFQNNVLKGVQPVWKKENPFDNSEADWLGQPSPQPQTLNQEGGVHGIVVFKNQDGEITGAQLLTRTTN